MIDKFINMPLIISRAYLFGYSPLFNPSIFAEYIDISAMKYSAKIDGLRFVAITLVLLEHFANGIANYIAAGYYGVNLFFL